LLVKESPVRKIRKGFSMFEMIVVLAVVAIALAVAVPLMSGMFGDTPSRAAADMVKSRWAEARAKAMEQGKPYRFQVIDDHRFRVAPDDTFDDDSRQPEELPRDVNFGADTANYTVVFQPDGTANTNLDLPLLQQNGPAVTLKLNRSTGVADLAR